MPQQNDKQIIVLAWVTEDGLEFTGRQVRYDGYNTKPEVRRVPKANACVWIKSGSSDDIARAENYGKTIKDAQRVAVYSFPRATRNPLDEARKRIMA